MAKFGCVCLNFKNVIKRSKSAMALSALPPRPNRVNGLSTLKDQYFPHNFHTFYTFFKLLLLCFNLASLNNEQWNEFNVVEMNVHVFWPYKERIIIQPRPFGEIRVKRALSFHRSYQKEKKKKVHVELKLSLM